MGDVPKYHADSSGGTWTRFVVPAHGDAPEVIFLAKEQDAQIRIQSVFAKSREFPLSLLFDVVLDHFTPKAPR